MSALFLRWGIQRASRKTVGSDKTSACAEMRMREVGFGFGVEIEIEVEIKIKIEVVIERYFLPAATAN